MSQLSANRFLRLPQIIGDRKRGIEPLIPVSRANWWQGVKSGRFPTPVKISPKVTVWKESDIRELISRIERGEG